MSNTNYRPMKDTGRGMEKPNLGSLPGQIKARGITEFSFLTVKPTYLEPLRIYVMCLTETRVPYVLTGLRDPFLIWSLQNRRAGQGGRTWLLHRVQPKKAQGKKP